MERLVQSVSSDIQRETLEIGERAVAEGAFMSRPQDDTGCLARLQCFLPTWRTQTPTVAGLQAGKAEFWYRCRKIIAARFGKLKKHGSHDGADSVTADVPSTGIAAAVSKESCHGFH